MNGLLIKYLSLISKLTFPQLIVLILLAMVMVTASKGPAFARRVGRVPTAAKWTKMHSNVFPIVPAMEHSI